MEIGTESSAGFAHAGWSLVKIQAFLATSDD